MLEAAGVRFDADLFGDDADKALILALIARMASSIRETFETPLLLFACACCIGLGLLYEDLPQLASMSLPDGRLPDEDGVSLDR